jgi:hypothetical protein
MELQGNQFRTKTIGELQAHCSGNNPPTRGRSILPALVLWPLLAAVTVSAHPTLAISDPSVIEITSSSATIGWTTNVAATSTIVYGTTPTYGSSVTLPTDATMHSIALTGLQSGTLYYYQVESKRFRATQSASGYFTTGTTVGAADTYGPGINADTKANLQVRTGQNSQVSHRFRASTTSTVTSVRFVQRGGPVYSGGTGGTIECTVQTDDGTANHFPSGTILATTSFTPGNSNPSGGWETYRACTFSTPPTLIQGNLYHIVYANTDPEQNTNWISVNNIYAYGTTLAPQQPHFSDTDYAVLVNTGRWEIAPNFTAPLDVTYANGAHDGQAYYSTIVGSYGLITGPSNMVREQFTVAGGNRTVTAAYVRVGKQTGNGDLTITLETGAGMLIEQGTVPASSVALSAPGNDSSGGNWVSITFATPPVLQNGQTYNLRLSAPAGTQFSMVPIRSGADIGFQSYAFPNGTGQKTTDGTTWSDLYPYSPENTQFYFTLSN